MNVSPRWLLLLSALAACGETPVAPPVGPDATPDVAADTPAPDAAVDAAVDAAADAAADGSAQDGAAVDAPATDGAALDGGSRTRLEGFVDEAARGLCDALYRCCDATSRAAFLAPMRANERLAALRDRIPADGRLDRAACAPLLADVYRVVPLGGWVSAALAGRVSFRPAEADACLARLAGAACGAELREALRDGTCLGFAPPEGGAAQRRMFAREAGEGSACTAIADGVGGALFGTCDPTRAFCCGGSAGRCAPVGSAVGTCRPAARMGESCGVSPELRVCATGLECDSATGRCVALGVAPLAVGDRCAMGLRLLGDCQGGYCDLGATDRCVALAADGAACTFAYECRGGACVSRRCAADTFCAAPGA